MCSAWSLQQVNKPTSQSTGPWKPIFAALSSDCSQLLATMVAAAASCGAGRSAPHVKRQDAKTPRRKENQWTYQGGWIEQEETEETENPKGDACTSVPSVASCSTSSRVFRVFILPRAGWLGTYHDVGDDRGPS